MINTVTVVQYRAYFAKKSAICCESDECAYMPVHQYAIDKMVVSQHRGHAYNSLATYMTSNVSGAIHMSNVTFHSSIIN